MVVDGSLPPRRSLRLVSASGSAEGQVKLSDRVRPGVIAATPLVDNAGGATIFLDSQVRIERL
jgi:hypothetical protein